MRRLAVSFLKAFQPFRSLSYVNRVRTFDWLRNDDSEIRAEFPKAKFLLFSNQQPLLTTPSARSALEACLLSHADLVKLSKSSNFELNVEKSALLDLLPDDGDSWTPLFAYGLRTKDSPVDEAALLRSVRTLGDPKCANADFVDLRRALFSLATESDGSLIAKAQTILRWSHTFKFCPSCGSPLTAKLSKCTTTCNSCHRGFFPPVSPVAICLITDPTHSHLLLVRQPRHPAGVFTAVAGFTEVGETLEQTVRREVAEEVGVELGPISYAGRSQHWPFPQSSLMCAFVAVAEMSQKPKIDESELEDAGWFGRSTIREAFDRSAGGGSAVFAAAAERARETKSPFSLVPPKGAVANQLIADWLQGRAR